MKKLLLTLTIILCATVAIGTLQKQGADPDAYRWDCIYWAIAAVESNFNHSAVGSNGCGMKSWGLKEINFHTATMIIKSTNIRETTHAPIFYTVCYAPFLIKFL